MFSSPIAVDPATCAHVFVRTSVVPLRLTTCAGCNGFCYVLTKLRRCNVCGLYYHEECFRRKLLSPSQRPMTPLSPGTAAEQRLLEEGAAAAAVTPPPLGAVLPAASAAAAGACASSTVVSSPGLPSTPTPCVGGTGGGVHTHQLLWSSVFLVVRCDACQGLVRFGLKSALTCIDCDAVFHEACAMAMIDEPRPAGVPPPAVILSVEELQRRDEEAKQAKAAASTVVTDTWSLLAQFNRNNKFWAMAAVNPLVLRSVQLEQNKLYVEACAAARDARIEAEELDNLRGALRFATAAYGLAYEEGHMSSLLQNMVMRIARKELTVPKAEPNNEAVCGILNMPRSALLYSRWGKNIFDPSCCVLIDESRRWVVLAFRGSLSDTDFLTDACGKLSPFHGSMAHQGMATMVDRAVADTKLMACLREARTAHPDYAMIVTGHSLGAGIAALFTIRLLEEGLLGSDGVEHREWTAEERSNRRSAGLRRAPPQASIASSWLRTYAFAPPPVLTMPAADQYDRVITSVVAAKDVVCRLQLSSLDRLGARLSRFMGRLVGSGASCTDGMSDGVEELFVPGGILFSTKPNNINARLVVIDRVSALLRDVFISSYMVHNHFLENYSAALATAAARLAMGAVGSGDNGVPTPHPCTSDAADTSPGSQSREERFGDATFPMPNGISAEDLENTLVLGNPNSSPDDCPLVP